MKLHTRLQIDNKLDGLQYQQIEVETSPQESSIVHVIEYDQKLVHLKLIASKASEALKPDQVNNHQGEGGTLDELIASQTDLRLAVNGTYSHYRKNFYDWQHDNYHVGDPVGTVKIRQHLYDDTVYPELNGYLERNQDKVWSITTKPDLKSKYILNSRPLLIDQGKFLTLPEEEMAPVPTGTINPPSFLGHGLQQHARTAVGSKKNANLVFVIAEGEGAGHSKGLTLIDLQEIGLYLDLDAMLNLDGGGSSRFWLKTEENLVLENATASEDADRVLGNVLMLFSTNLARA
jgi:hypothetical protein